MRASLVFRTGGVRRSLLVVALAAGLAGCGGSAVPTHPVRGKVLFEGKPAENALVILHPLDPVAKDAPRPLGKVDSDGSFTVSTFREKDGAPAGDYSVTVQWWLSSAKGTGGWQDDVPPTNRLPARYSLTGASGLRAHVQAGANELPTFQLKK